MSRARFYYDTDTTFQQSAMAELRRVFLESVNEMSNQEDKDHIIDEMDTVQMSIARRFDLPEYVARELATDYYMIVMLIEVPRKLAVKMPATSGQEG